MWDTAPRGAQTRCNAALHRLASVLATTLDAAPSPSALPRKVVPAASPARPIHRIDQPLFALAFFLAFAETFLTLAVTLWTRSRKVAATTRPTRFERWALVVSVLRKTTVAEPSIPSPGVGTKNTFTRRQPSTLPPPFSWLAKRTASEA